MRERWYVHALALGLLAAGVALAFSDVLSVERGLYFRDHLNIFRPRWAAVWECLRRGELPALTHAIPSGIPLEASLNLAIYTPPTLLLLAGPFDVTYDLFVAAHFLLLGAGAYGLACELGARPVEALLAAAIAALSGPVIALENLLVILQGLAWAPWVHWALVRVYAAPTLSRAGALALAVGCHAQAILPELLLLDLTAALILALHLRPRIAPRLIGALALAGGLGLGVSAITVAPGLELLAASRRGSGFNEATRAFWSLRPAQLVDLIAPSFWMPPEAPFLNVQAVTGAPQGPFFTSLYLGTGLVLGLAAAPLVLAGGPARRPAALLFGAAVVHGLIALGPLTPLHGLTRFIPLLGSARYPIKYLLLVTAALAALAPLALRAFEARPRAIVLVAVFQLLLVGSIVWTLGLEESSELLKPYVSGGGGQPPIIGLVRSEWPWRLLESMRSRAIHGMSYAAGLLALALVHGLLPAEARLRAPLRWAMVGLVLVDLAAGATWTVFGASVRDGWPPREVAERLASAERRIYILAPDGQAPPATHVEGHSYLEDQIVSTRRRRLDAYPEIRRYQDTDSEALSNPIHAWAFAQLESSRGRDGLRLMARAGVSAVTSWVAGFPAARADGYEVPGERPEHVYRLDDPRPYVRAYARWLPLQREALGRAGLAAAAAQPERWDVALLFDPSAEAVLGPSRTSTACDARVRASLDQGRSALPERLAIDFEGECDALVVALEPRMPGWTATVDGGPAPVITAELGYIGVAVPAGRHQVGFRYEARVRRWGPVSLACGLVALGLIFAGRRSRRWLDDRARSG